MAKKRNWNGSKWLYQPTRLAVYLRGGLSCAYCGAGVEDGVVLSVDHVVPVNAGGENDPENYVCSCRKCNGEKGDQDLVSFAIAKGAEIDVDPVVIVEYVNEQRTRDIQPFRDLAREQIKLRGSYGKALAEIKDAYIEM